MIVKTLILDDDELVLSILEGLFLKTEYKEFECYHKIDDFIDNFDQNTNIAVIDYRLPEPIGLEIFKKTKTINPECIFILISDSKDADVLADFFNNGGKQFIDKEDNKWVTKLIETVLFYKEEIKKQVKVKQAIEHLDSMVTIMEKNLNKKKNEE